MKACIKCGSELRCLKTGLTADIEGFMRIGDLFGCPICGCLHIHGITNLKEPFKICERDQNCLHCTVTSYDQCGTDRNGYLVFADVEIDATERLVNFMKDWNERFLEMFPKQFTLK